MYPKIHHVLTVPSCLFRWMGLHLSPALLTTKVSERHRGEALLKHCTKFHHIPESPGGSCSESARSFNCPSSLLEGKHHDSWYHVHGVQPQHRVWHRAGAQREPLHEQMSKGAAD